MEFNHVLNQRPLKESHSLQQPKHKSKSSLKNKKKAREIIKKVESRRRKIWHILTYPCICLKEKALHSLHAYIKKRLSSFASFPFMRRAYLLPGVHGRIRRRTGIGRELQNAKVIRGRGRYINLF